MPSSQEIYQLTEREFTVLFDQYWSEVYRICHYYTNEKAAAEDLTQNVFTITWQKRDMLQEKELLAHFLFRCAKLEALSYVKQQASRREKLHQMQGDASSAFTSNTTEADILYAEAQAKLKNALAELPEKTKLVFEMSQLQGAEVKTIAQTLKLGKKSVEYHLYKAIKKIKSTFLFLL
ncbi:sigma-70 family RNA polymerase sigma factor [Sphingobacterium bambusae]|uniref:Sigma-70 family RNA polymerase sigma factor n=1 Tax=Sphingobacterium bambusae TaxID=662858 RepID=A0ABW6BFM9_9SPHI